jgi:Plasmid encoded RepA protein
MTGPGRRQMRLLRAAEEVRLQPLPDNHARIFAARQLVQATLPHREPQGVPPEWSRTNGNYTLSIRPGWRTDSKTGKRQCIGYPYGSIPRLLLFWMTTEAVLTKSRKLPLGATLAEFMRELGLDPSRGGKRSDARRLQEQMERLFRATISFEYYAVSDGRERSDWLDMQVAAKGHLWWDLTDTNQLHLSESYVELSEEFYQAITAHPVPADMRALRVLKQSPLALDLYAWVTYRAHRVNQAAKPVIVTWRQLQQQLGADFSDNREFARKLKGALAKVLALYPHLRIEVVRGGLQIYPGPSLTLLP